MLTKVSATARTTIAGRSRKRTDAKRPASCLAKPRRAARRSRGGIDRRTRHQPAAGRIRRPLDRAAIHEYAAARYAPVFVRNQRAARVLAPTGGTRWRA